MTITEFLEARISEDERREAGKWRVRSELLHHYQVGQEYVELETRDGLKYDRLTLEEFRGKYGEDAPAARALAECAAKRAIVAEHGRDDSSTKDYCDTCAEWWKSEVGEGPPGVEWPCPTIRAVAAVYADHADYDPAWKLAG